MRLLFVKEQLAWPRTSGHDVHTYYMMRSIQRLGHEVGLVTRRRCAPEAIAGLELKHVSVLEGASPETGRIRLDWLQERFRSYWGLALADLEVVAATVEEFRPDVLVAVGLDGLPYVAAAGSARAVWYAADEWFLHHMTLVDARSPGTWAQLVPATVKLLYERSYASLIDRAWVVSRADQRSMRWCAGVKAVDVLPNGVDAEYFAPTGVATKPRSCVFWGRLDFEPNIQALQWFLRHVWPIVLHVHPDATLRVIGANPVVEVLGLAKTPGVSLHSNVADLRELLHDMEVAIMPFVSGGGIKNKILEAAAIGKPVICTPRAFGGLRASPPFVVAEGGEEWARQLTLLWQGPERRAEVGREAREWVLRHHAWEATASTAMQALQS